MMNWKKMSGTALLLIAVLCVAGPVFAAAITNGDFEDGSLNGWSTNRVGNTTSDTYAPHAVTVSPGIAPFSLGLQQVHSGNYSAELYSGWNYTKPYITIWQDVVIPALETDLETWFAAVVSGAHNMSSPLTDSYVQFDVINLTDSSTVYTVKYGYYYNFSQLVAGDPSVYQGPWSYLPWQQMTVHLASYAGATLRIQYTAYGCSASGHYCTGYIDDLRFVQPPTFTYTPTVTPTVTQTHTDTVTKTVTQTVTPTTTPTFTPTFTVTPTVTNTPVPFAFELKGPFPNPGINETRLVYWLSREAPVSFKVYTVSGEVVREETDQGDPGYNAWYWDGYNADRKRVASGVFIIRAYATDPIFGGSTPPSYTKAAILR